MTQDQTKNDVSYEKPDLQQKVPGKTILHAPQPVTALPGSPVLADVVTTLTDLYNGLLKEGLIKPK